MKKRTCIVTLLLICLSAACTSIGKNANTNAQDNRETPANTRDAGSPAADSERTVTPARVGSSFKGTIGDLKVEMDIKRDGGNLSGNYYYVKSGSSNRLMLKGKIDADGSFTMQEADAAGKQTGEFKGKWKEEPYESGATLEGEWSKPGQTGEPLGFYAFEQMVYFTSTQVTTREMKESIKAKKAELTAAYPELSGGANAAGFNQLAKARVTKSLTGFKKDLAGVSAADIKAMGDMGNYIEVDYTIEFADEDLVSINFGEETFTGGAHPNHGTFTLTYDLKAGREITLSDLFKPGSKYLASIAAYSLRDLRSRKDPDTGENMGIAQDVWEEGAKPTAANYSNWNITKKGLMFTFPPYQVAAYALGPQTVIVPYAELKNIARSDGPLDKSKK